MNTQIHFNLNEITETKRVDINLNQFEIFNILKEKYYYSDINKISKMIDFCKINQLNWLLTPLNKLMKK